VATFSFTDCDDFMSHVITPFPMSKGRSEKFYGEFLRSGYVAIQSETGLPVGAALWGADYVREPVPESRAEPKHFESLVMLSHPSMTDDEYFGWVEIVRSWLQSLPQRTVTAYLRKIEDMKYLDRGIPLRALNESLPAQLLFTYPRLSEHVIVIDPLTRSKRTIYTTKGLG
jgi:hypothetical protein